MVLAISFLEAPLKFRAPGVSLQVGLSIGRLVFRALNVCEAMLAAVVVVALLIHPAPARVIVAFAITVLALIVQLVVVRPALSGRSDAVLAGHTGSRSRVHYAYVALEAVKVIALLTTGILLLTAEAV